MRKPLLKVLLCLLIVPTFVASCTTSDSGGAEDESVESELNSELDDMSGVKDETVSEDDLGDSSDIDDIEADAATDDGDLDAGGDDDFFAEDAEQPDSGGTSDLAEKDLQQELEKGEFDTADTALNEPPAAVEPAPAATVGGGSSAVTSKETPVSASDGFEAVPPPTLQMPTDDLGISDPLVSVVDPPLPGEKAAKDNVPISKVRKEPFVSKAGRLMNTVYIARPGDDGGTISQKLFDKDNKAILEEDNDDMRRGVNVGDKIYYTSVNRPDDKKEMLTYYEDKKLPVSYYITKESDNIQKIGREVLGYDDAWKEVWATNDSLQSQAMLPAGLKIRYWSGNELTEPPPEAPIMATTDPADMGGGDATPPPAVVTTPEPETLPDLSEATTEEPIQTGDATPMPAEIATPPPDVNPPAIAKEGGDSLLTVAGIAIIGLGVLTLVAIQIKNRKKDDGSIPPSMEFTKV